MKSNIENKIKKEIANEENEIKEIWRRIRKRDFSGNTGLVIKNSIYNFSRTFVAKIGSLLFTIIIARLLMPELFGFYALALSIIIIFTAISELGINQALVRFVSNSLGKNKKKKANNYIKYFGKIKVLLILLSISLLLIFSRSISESLYQKPIFLALLAGVFYIIFIQISSFFIAILNSLNDFKNVLFQEIIFQIARVIFIPLAVIFSLKLSLSDENILFYIFLFLAFSYLISGIYLLFIIKKRKYFNPKIKGAQNLSKRERKGANRFIFLTSAIVLSGVFFGNIDKIMLGHFVSGEFIGYYQAAFSLIGALISLSVFGGVLLPIFSRMKEKNLKKAMKKTIRIVFLISLGIFILTLLFSYLGILIIYGKEYLPAVNILRLLSILILILPLTSIYITYFMSKNKPQIVAKSLILSTILNIILNYILITLLLQYGYLQAVYGATIATLISQGVYLGILRSN